MEQVIPLAVSLAVTAVLGLVLIPFLRRLKFGQSIREEGPAWHMSKQGTPTMGGWMFIAGITVSVLAFGLPLASQGIYAHLYILGFSWLYGLIGFVDDYVKVVKKRNLGLTAPQKFALQLAVAAVLILALRHSGYLTSDVYIPFVQVTLPLPWLVFLVTALIYTVGFVNAVNLTDGIDGLCTGVTLPVAGFFAVMSFSVWNRPEITLFSVALVGGLLGFLLFNFHPAKVFMGDTGSLFLGGAVCGLALAVDRPLLLVLVGLVYLIEMLSVVIQVLYFKATKGKRVFRMTPIHHHFELGGMGERTLFALFTGVTTVLCVITYFVEK